MDREKEKAQIDILYHEVLAYRSSEAFQKMMDSVRKLPQLSPYNAMMVALQKPGSVFVATPSVWRERYHRYPKPEARPLVILRPFGPICFVYEYNDTEGRDHSRTRRCSGFSIRSRRIGLSRRTAIGALRDRLIFEGIRYREEDLGDPHGSFHPKGEGAAGPDQGNPAITALYQADGECRGQSESGMHRKIRFAGA
jgi:hypothetical protein